MKSPRTTCLIVGALVAGFLGCEKTPEPPEPDAKPHAEAASAPQVRETPAPPVDPSPVPAMPDPRDRGMEKKDEAPPAEKKDGLPAKAEPAAEIPK